MLLHKGRSSNREYLTNEDYSVIRYIGLWIYDIKKALDTK